MNREKTNKIRVAFIEHTAKLGGAQFNHYVLQKYLDRNRYDPVAICPSEGPLTAELRQLGVRTVIIPMLPLLSTSTRIGRIQFFNVFSTFLNVIILIPVVFSLVQFLKKEEIQVVLTNGMVPHFYGGLAAKILGIPVIWRVEDIIREKLLFGIVKWFFKKTAAHLPDLIIVPSRAVKISMLPGSRFEDKVRVIYNTADIDDSRRQLAQTVLREEYGLSEDEIAVGVLSRLTPWKGQREFIKAAKQVIAENPKVKFFIVGSPTFESPKYEKELKGMVQKLHLEKFVVFTGFRKDIPECIASLDICVLPSILPDPCPRIVLEGMTMGKPFIATNCGGVPEILLDGESGILIPPRDIDRLAQAMLYLIKHPEIRRQLGKNACLRATKIFTPEKFVSGHRQALEDAFGILTKGVIPEILNRESNL